MILISERHRITRLFNNIGYKILNNKIVPNDSDNWWSEEVLINWDILYTFVKVELIYVQKYELRLLFSY